MPKTAQKLNTLRENPCLVSLGPKHHHSSTVCGQVRAGKLTWASLSVVQHSATASALVRARMYLSAACSMTLLQPCRLAVPAIQRRGGVRRCGLKQYSERNALAVLLALRWRACAMRVAGWYRKTDLTRIERASAESNQLTNALKTPRASRPQGCMLHTALVP